MRTIILILTAGIVPLGLCAQDNGSVTIQAEIIPATLSLTISSSRLNFGQVSSDAGEVRIDPANGQRGGKAFGSYSTGNAIMTGPPGMPFVVHVTSPPTLSAPRMNHSIGYDLLWAQTPECTLTGFTRIVSEHSIETSIGPSGCTRFQIGGVLALNGASPGLYNGTMMVHVVAQ